MPSYKENQKDGKQRGPDGKLYVIPGGPLDPAAKNNKAEAPKYFEGATDAQKAAFDKGVEFVNVGGGVFQNRMGQYVDSSGKATNAPAPTAPKTMDDRAKDLLSGQLQDQQKLADELGLDTQYPTTFEGIIQERADAQAREAAQARAELERQKELIIQQAGDVKKSSETQIAGVKSALAQDREGPFSAGNVATQERTTAALKEQIDRAIATQNAALQKVQNIEQAIKDAERQGNRDLVDLYQGQLEAAKFELTQADTALLDAQVSASEEARAVQEATRQNFETFTSFVNEGQTLTVQGIKNLAGQLNIDFESAFDYYQSVENIRVDKSLSQTEKEIALQDAALELDRKMTNRDLEEVRKVDYLTSLYQSGASADEISAYKQLAGITDYNDPIQAAKLRIEQANAKIKELEASGEIVYGSKEYYEVEKLKQDIKINELEMQETYGTTGGAYVPTTTPKENIEVSYDGGEFNIYSPENRQFSCAAGVNRTYGTSFGDTYTQKQGIIDNAVSNGTGILSQNVVDAKSQIKAGMIFVMPIAGQLGGPGHVGIVKSVNDDGTFNTIEWNANGALTKGGVFDGPNNQTTEKRVISQMYGFMQPPNAGLVGATSTGDYSPKVQAQAEAIMNSTSLNTSGLSTKDNFRGEVEQLLAEKQQQFREQGDIRNVLLASAGGSKPSDTFLQNLSKGKVLVNQLDELTNALFQGDIKDAERMKTDDGEKLFDFNPITGWVKSKNPWDRNAQEITAIIQGAVPNLARGIYGEVGVLTDRDIELYKKTLPNLSQTEDVQKAVAGLTMRIVKNSLEESLLTQADNGRNVQGNVRYLDELNKKIDRIEKSLGIEKAETEDPLINSINQATNYINQYGSDEASLANQFGLTF